MNVADITKLQSLMRSNDWASVYAMLDDARNRAVSSEDIRREAYWRVAALRGEQRYEEALQLLRKSAGLFNSQCLVHLDLAYILIKLGRDKEALHELSSAPIEEEMEEYYGLAIDTKFLYFYLLAKSGNSSVKDRLAEIPDDYRHITMGGKFLTKADIASFLK